MIKLLYPIYKLPQRTYERNIPTWVKYWLYTKSFIENVMELSEILTGSEFTLLNTVSRKFKIFELSGRTEQEELISPDYPQDVEVVTGENTVKVVNKNLFDKNNVNSINNAYINSSGVITRSGTTGDEIIYIACKSNTTYTIQKMLSMRFRIGCSDTIPTIGTTLSQFSGNQQSNQSYTITSGSSSKYLVFWGIDKDETSIRQQILNSIMIELGSTATTYTEHKEQDFPISLSSRNLFDKNVISIGYLSNDGTITSDNIYRTSDFIKVKGNIAYYKTYTASPRTKFYDKNKQVLDTSTYQDISIGGNAGTFTTPNNAVYFRFSFPISGGSAVDIDTVQIEEGSTPTSYQPYYNYELCKIGDYQDCIWKDESTGKWYVKKIIGKVDLSTLIWTLNSGRFIANNIPNGITAPINTRLQVYSDYYKYASSGAPDNGIFYYANGNVTQLYVYNSKFTTLNDYNNWTNQTKPVAYYLATPTDIEITDTTLIEQLDNFKNAYTYKDITNISGSSSELEPNLVIQYWKRREAK